MKLHDIVTLSTKNANLLTSYALKELQANPDAQYVFVYRRMAGDTYKFINTAENNIITVDINAVDVKVVQKSPVFHDNDIVRFKHIESYNSGIVRDSLTSTKLRALSKELHKVTTYQDSFRYYIHNIEVSPWRLEKVDVPDKHYVLPRGLYRKFEIPRKHKAPRAICAPDSTLLKYQHHRLPFLVKEFHQREEQAGLSNVFHGFIPNRNCVTAATQHIGYDITIMMDIVAFFDNVTRDHLKLIKLCNNDNFYTNENYCGQGLTNK